MAVHRAFIMSEYAGQKSRITCHVLESPFARQESKSSGIKKAGTNHWRRRAIIDRATLAKVDAQKTMAAEKLCVISTKTL